MDATAVILLLIAAILAVGLWMMHRQSRQRSRDTEMLRSALYAAHFRDTRIREPVSVTFDKQTNNAMRRFQQAAVDIQGIVELASRHLVSQMAPEVLDGMEPPEDWATVEKINRQGVTKRRDA